MQAPYGNEIHYIAIERKSLRIMAPLTDVQITSRFGPKWQNDNTGTDWAWGLMTGDMAKLLLAGQPTRAAPDDSKLQGLLNEFWDTANVLAECGANLTAASGRLKTGLAAHGVVITAPGGPFELAKEGVKDAPKA